MPLTHAFALLLLLQQSDPAAPAAPAAPAPAAPAPAPAAPAAESAEVKVMTLEDCVRLSQSLSPQVRIAQSRFESSRYSIDIARAVYDLRLTSSSSRNLDGSTDRHSLGLRQELPAGFAASLQASSVRDREANLDDSELAFTLSKRLLGGGSWNASMQQIFDARADAIIALNKLREERRRAALDVRQRFYALAQALQNRAIRSLRLDIARRNLQIAEAREEPLDIKSAQIELPQAELQLKNAEYACANELDRLKAAIGIHPAQPLIVSPELNCTTFARQAFAELTIAEENSESFVNNRLNRLKLERDHQIRSERTLPALDLSYTHRLADDSPDQVNFSGDADDILGLQLSWNLFSRAERAQLGFAVARIEENEYALLALRHAKMLSLLEIDRLLSSLELSMTTQQEQIKLITDQVTLYKDRYENGDIPILEYLRAQNSLIDARITLSALQSQYMANAARYRFELGTDADSPPATTLPTKD